jgi:hypothetical protein
MRVAGVAVCAYHGEVRSKALGGSIPPILCIWGCGRMNGHAGICKERHRLAAAHPPPKPVAEIVKKPVEVPKKVKAVAETAESLVFEVVPVDQIPLAPVAKPKVVGRVGRIWVELEKIPVGMALKVTNRDRDHAGATRRRLQGQQKQRNQKLLIVTEDAKGADDSRVFLFIKRIADEVVSQEKTDGAA